MPKILPFRLVPDSISHDTIDALQELCRHAKRRELIGLAYVAMYRGKVYVANTTGEAHRNPTFARGMVKALDDKLAEMVGSRLIDP